MRNLFTLLLLAALLSIQSCSILNSTTTNLTDRTFLTLEVVQTLNNESALAVTKDGKIVNVTSLEQDMYDGKTISGEFIRLDTYTYETREGYSKTVPVYMQLNEYSRLKKTGTL